MKYTNKHNLPKHICNWLEADFYDYNPDTISATTLIGPARAWALKRKHAEELTADYSDMLSLRYGTAIHDSLEKVWVFSDGDFREIRYTAEIAGFVISGKMDAVLGGVIRDNKSTSVWKFVHGEFEDYIKQLSIYKWLLWKNGIETESYGMIDFFFTDWKRSDALRGGNYPKIRYQEQRIELWTVQQTEAFIQDRLEEFAFAETLLPECSDDELWKPETKYAVYKKNKDGSRQMRAFRVCDTADDANKISQEVSGEIEVREGKAKRCAYCFAAPFCEQFARMQEAGVVDVVD